MGLTSSTASTLGFLLHRNFCILQFTIINLQITCHLGNKLCPCLLSYTWLEMKQCVRILSVVDLLMNPLRCYVRLAAS
jgi:hypothetical protein